MSDGQYCRHCGATLVGENADGACLQCPACAALATEATPVPVVGNTIDYERPSLPKVPAELADRFPHLEIEGLLGRGGMGSVYRARQPRLDRLVALKILSVELSKDPAFVERFGREARALARLHHPHIVGVYDSGAATVAAAPSCTHGRGLPSGSQAYKPAAVVVSGDLEGRNGVGNRMT
jgi:Protein kinase domain